MRTRFQNSSPLVHHRRANDSNGRAPLAPCTTAEDRPVNPEPQVPVVQPPTTRTMKGSVSCNTPGLGRSSGPGPGHANWDIA